MIQEDIEEQWISNLMLVCRGDFFTRRFLSDGTQFWKLLITSPFHKESCSKDESIPLQLPYRSNSMNSKVSFAETSNLKVQIEEV